MNEKTMTIVAGLVTWVSIIVVLKIFNGATKNKSLNRCSNVVKKEIKNIKRYNKSINDSCK